MAIAKKVKPLVWAEDGLPEGSPWDYGYETFGDQVIAWCEETLAQPDGILAGEPWRFAPYQERWILWWYSVDAIGKLLFRAGQLVLPKGMGKSPFAAAIACAELAGPVIFDHFDKNGQAVSAPHPSPYVQIAARSEDQTKNTLSLARGMFERGPGKHLVPGLVVNKTTIETANGMIVMATANASSQEGKRTTAAILDETQHWTETSGGHALYKTIRGNLVKMAGRAIETTNAWRVGEDSQAERTGESVDLQKAGRARKRTTLQMWRKAPADLDIADEQQLAAALANLYEGCPWVPLESYIDEIYDPGMPIEHSRRMFLNQIISSDDQLVTPVEWGHLLVEDRLKQGDEITLGFDGGSTDDATALVACRIRDRYMWPIGIWERPRELPKEEKWHVDKDAVNDAVGQAFTNFKVRGFFADVELWETHIDMWAREYGEHLEVKATGGHLVKWDMRGRLKERSEAHMRLVRGIQDGDVLHGGQMDLTRHVLNTRARYDKRGNASFGKESRDSRKKIDAYAAMLLADHARAQLLNQAPKHDKSKGGAVAWY